MNEPDPTRPLSASGPEQPQQPEHPEHPEHLEDPAQAASWQMTWEEPRPGGRHPVNTAHLVMGVAFLGLVAVWALLAGDVVRGDDARWLLPLPWLVGGALGLAVSTTKALRARP